MNLDTAKEILSEERKNPETITCHIIPNQASGYAVIKLTTTGVFKFSSIDTNRPSMWININRFRYNAFAATAIASFDRYNPAILLEGDFSVDEIEAAQDILQDLQG